MLEVDLRARLRLRSAKLSTTGGNSCPPITPACSTLVVEPASIPGGTRHRQATDARQVWPGGWCPDVVM